MLNYLCLNQELTFLKEVSLIEQHKGWNELSDEVTNNIQDLSLPDFKRRLTLKLAHE